MNYSTKAKELFLSGHNCAQAVFLAFSDLTGLDETATLRLSASFGGGMGKLREVCGAVSGMFMVAGLLYGPDDPTDQSAKSEHYARIQYLASKFREKNGSIICRDLLGLSKSDGCVPSVRTNEYYSKRPCADLVSDAAEILEKYISENPPKH